MSEGTPDPLRVFAEFVAMLDMYLGGGDVNVHIGTLSQKARDALAEADGSIEQNPYVIKPEFRR